MGFAAPRAVTPKATVQQASRTAAIHATRGIVKSMDANSLVITRQGKKHDEMTFSLNGSTRHDGTVAVGSRVSIRYQREGNANVATAITAANSQKKSTHTRASAAK